MNTENDQQLDDKQLSALYSQTQQDEPPANLNKMIIAAAKQPAASRAIGPFSNSWRIPASLAAVLILSVGVTTLMENDINRVDEPAPVFDEISNDAYQPLAVITEELKTEEEPQQLMRKSSPAKEKMKIMKRNKLAVAVPPVDKIKIKQGVIASKKPNKKIARTLSDSVEIQAVMPALKSKSTSVVSLDSIKALRIAGKQPLANKKIDELILQHFGEDLDNIEPTQVKLSNMAWQNIINELRQLDRESLAVKLENILKQRINN